MKVFLTGASAGIGLECARLLCQAGHEVWGSSRSLERLPAMANFHPVQLDLLDLPGIPRAVDRVWKDAGGIDVLINNAGQAVFGSLELMPEEELRRQFELLFFGPMLLTQQISARMRAARGGTVINVTSLAVELPIPFMGAYNAAKSALAAATASLRLELADDRVRFVDLRPGDISTGFNSSVTRSQGCENRGAKDAWSTIEKNMAEAPPADCVAEKILQIMGSGRPRTVVRVGDWFQAALAPWGPKILSPGFMEKLIRLYYRIR